MIGTRGKTDVTEQSIRVEIYNQTYNIRSDGDNTSAGRRDGLSIWLAFVECPDVTVDQDQISGSLPCGKQTSNERTRADLLRRRRPVGSPHHP